MGDADDFVYDNPAAGQVVGGGGGEEEEEVMSAAARAVVDMLYSADRETIRALTLIMELASRDVQPVIQPLAPAPPTPPPPPPPPPPLSPLITVGAAGADGSGASDAAVAAAALVAGTSAPPSTSDSNESLTPTGPFWKVWGNDPVDGGRGLSVHTAVHSTGKPEKQVRKAFPAWSEDKCGRRLDELSLFHEQGTLVRGQLICIVKGTLHRGLSRTDTHAMQLTHEAYVKPKRNSERHMWCYANEPAQKTLANAKFVALYTGSDVRQDQTPPNAHESACCHV